jgi:hypothetical protein
MVRILVARPPSSWNQILHTVFNEWGIKYKKRRDFGLFKMLSMTNGKGANILHGYWMEV